jgi:hypothetical protein
MHRVEIFGRHQLLAAKGDVEVFCGVTGLCCSLQRVKG